VVDVKETTIGSLVIEPGDNSIGALLALKDNLGNDNRTRLEQPTAHHQSTHGRHGALDIRRRGAGGEVLRHHDGGAGQASYAESLVEPSAALGVVGRRRSMVVVVVVLQLCSYQGLGNLRCATLLSLGLGTGGW
jgi:hypothetical protein